LEKQQFQFLHGKLDIVNPHARKRILSDYLIPSYLYIHQGVGKTTVSVLT